MHGIAEDAWTEVMADRVNRDPEFVTEIEQAIEELSRDEQRLLVAQPPAATELERPALDDKHGDAMNRTLGIFREDREVRGARARLACSGITAVVFGHTHDIVDGALDGCLWNPGSWVPHLDLKNPAVAAKIMATGLTLEMLGDSTLYAVERRAVHIIVDSKYRANLALVAIP